MSSKTYTLPAGTYVISDLCYVFDGNQWSRYCNEVGFGDESMAEFEGMTTLSFSTAWGDGGYLGSDGVEYYVDSGTIGAVTATEAVLSAYNKCTDLGSLVTFTEPVQCSRSAEGVLKFGHITIDTDPPVDEDDDDYYGEEIY